MPITNISSAQLRGIGIYNGVEIPAGSGFSNTKSLDFDGVDDYVNCGNVTDLDNAPNASWSFWMKPSATGLRYMFSAYQGGGPNQQIQFHKKGTGVSIRLRGQGYVGGTPIMFNESSQSWNLGSWYHVVVTFDGSESDAQKVKVYINDSALTNTSSGAAITNINTTTSDFYIAAYNSSNEFAGNIDEFAIFDTTLSASDVTSIYNSGTPADLTSLNPVAWWRMGDDATFPTIPDEVGSNDGTMTNMVAGDIVTDTP
jgi:hypothetical protein